MLFIRSISAGRFRGSFRHSNRNSSNGGSSSGTIGGGLSDCYFGNEEKIQSSVRNENSRKYNRLGILILSYKKIYNSTYYVFSKTLPILNVC